MPTVSFRHYYGNIIRYIFLATALIMIIGLPLFQNFLGIPKILSVIGIAVLGIAAGFTNPKLMISLVINFFISLFGFIIFLYSAASSYQGATRDDKYLLASIVLAAMFLFAVYYSMKTLRSALLEEMTED